MTVAEIAEAAEHDAQADAQAAAGDYFSALAAHHRGDNVSADAVAQAARRAGFTAGQIREHEAALARAAQLRAVAREFADSQQKMKDTGREIDKVVAEIARLADRIDNLKVQRTRLGSDLETFAHQEGRRAAAEAELRVIREKYPGLI